MRRAITILFLLAGLFLIPTVAESQIVVDTATVIVYIRADLETTVTPTRVQGEPGDTVTFRGVTVDGVSGDTVIAAYKWRSNGNQVQIDSLTGFAILQTRGRAQVYPEIETLYQIVAAVFDPDDSMPYLANNFSFIGDPADPLFAGETVIENAPYNVNTTWMQYTYAEEPIVFCTYGVGEFGTVMYKSNEVCPNNVLGNELNLWTVGKGFVDPSLAYVKPN